jgi:hypothetical protein
MHPNSDTDHYIKVLIQNYAKIIQMNTQNEIISFLQHNKTLLQNKYHITKIGIFGSFARNEQNAESDVDILIELENGTENIYDLKNSLKLFLSQSFGRSVDIAREKYLKPFAKEQIMKDALFV